MREKNNEETREKIERKRGRNRRITEINENQLNKKKQGQTGHMSARDRKSEKERGKTCNNKDKVQPMQH